MSPTSKITQYKLPPTQLKAHGAGLMNETTVAVARYAPFNAIALLVGSQVGRPGVLTQCSLEEATELKLGMLGHTCYAETISVYGTEPVFTDGDDTPWSKGFLASSYASRGLKCALLPAPALKYRWLRGRQINALPRGSLHLHHQSRRRSGSAEWFGKLHRCSISCAIRHPRSISGKLNLLIAGSGMRLQ